MSWLIFFSKGSSLKSLITKLMLAILVYYIWRERNARLHGEAPYNSSIVYSDIVAWEQVCLPKKEGG